MINEIKKGRITHKVIRNNLEYEIEPFILIKYHINTGKEFSNSEWNSIIKDNEFYFFDRIAQNKLKKMLTKQEVITFLEEKLAPKIIINQLVLKYEKYGYIDDTNYTKIFIEQRKRKDGPKLIFKKLINKGIEKTIINNELSKIDEEDIINNLVIKSFETEKGKTKKQIINKVKLSLTKKGFNYEIINNIINKNLDYINVDELNLLEKEYNKLLIRKSTKLDLNEFKFKTRNKLLLKGFSLENIKTIENKLIK